MNFFEHQQQDETIRRMGQVIRSVTVPQRSETDWQKLEDKLFESLQRQETQPVKKANVLSFPATHPLAAAAAAALLAITSLWYFVLQMAPSPVSLSVLGTPKDVIIESKQLSGSQRFQIDKHKPTILKTGSEPLTVRLDDGSGFLLKSNSILKIRESNQKNFRALLKKGEILASVNKSDNARQFIISSPNARSSVLGTIFSVAVGSEKADHTVLSVFRGAVEFSPKLTGNDSKVIARGSSITCIRDDLGPVEPLSESNTPIRDISFLTTALEITRDTATIDGMIEFASNPSGAKVSIGGKIIGTTPLVAQYPAGIYIARVYLDGYETKKDTLRVQPGGISTVSTVLKMHAAEINTDRKPKAVVNNIHRSNKALQRKELMRPEYVEALIQINVGEYRKALEALEQLRDNPSLNRAQKRQVIEKITQCYRGLGDFNKAIKRLEKQYDKAHSNTEKSSLLWQIATMRLNCLGDFDGVRKNLQQYLAKYPQGSWYEQALLALAEIYYLQGEASPAIDLYKRHIKQFASSKEIDHALFRLGRIHIEEMNEPEEAVTFYEKLIEDHIGSVYYEYALYELHQQYKNLGKNRKAEALYNDYIVNLMPEQWSAISSQYE
ncbi:MAG: tetratricopeptide repeat protein [Fibrobacterota bacterium]